MSSARNASRAASSVGPATGFSAVTPNDGVDLPRGACRSLFVGGAGTVAVMAPDGSTAVFVSAAGQYHPISVQRVLATGTSATGIVALY